MSAGFPDPTQNKKGFVHVIRKVVCLYGGLFRLGLCALGWPIRIGSSRWSGESAPTPPSLS